ncbi:hypothetical protein ACSDR0_01635 [Streptosporangium sp. G11]
MTGTHGAVEEQHERRRGGLWARMTTIPQQLRQEQAEPTSVRRNNKPDRMIMVRIFGRGVEECTSAKTRALYSLFDPRDEGGEHL